MAHEIGSTDNLFLVKTPAWHNLGTVLESAPQTSAEAIRAAGLDWPVELQQMFARSTLGESVLVDDAWCTMRIDREHGNIPLGVVGARYTPLQNEEAFSFFDPIIADKIASYETAGSLRDGKKVWILAKMNSELMIGDNDKIDKFILLSNSHDGSNALTVKISPIRVVCQNTLSAALRAHGNISDTINIRHTKSINDRLQQAQKTLETVNKSYEVLGKIWSKMSEIKMPPIEVSEYVNSVFSSKKDDASKQLQTVRAEVHQLISSGTGQHLETAMGTLWGAYQGITEHVTHSISTRKNSSLDTHMDNLWFGRLRDKIDDAFDVALNVMESKGIDLATI
jgi:phage/plasmid-like protein (TIGR03299 family)